MKRILIYAAVGLLASLLVACNKEMKPTNAIAPSSSVGTEADLISWRNSFYNSFRYSHGSDYWDLSELQSDMFNASVNFGNAYAEFQTWTIQANNRDVEALYRDYYNSIRNINFFLDNVSAFKADSPRAEANLKTTLGVAYFCRAYYYFKLAQGWSRLYNPDDVCVSLLTKFDVNKSYPRATQKEVFTVILQDLEKAEANVGGLYKVVPSSANVTAAVVKALRARVYLNMKEWAKAKAEAESVINMGVFQLEANADALADVWTNDAVSPEIIMQCFFSYPDELPYAAGMYQRWIPSKQIYAPYFVPSPDAYNMYDDTDVRKKIYFKSDSLTDENTTKKHMATMLAKFPGNAKLQSPKDGPRYRNAPKPFRIAEQYLIAAEAAFMAQDEAAAKTHLNALRTARGLVALAESGNALLEEIRDERTRELLREGFRLWDLRRWGKPCKRITPENPGVLFKSPDYLHLDKANDNARFVWPIPTTSINAANGVLKQNPGY